MPRGPLRVRQALNELPVVAERGVQALHQVIDVDALGAGLRRSHRAAGGRPKDRMTDDRQASAGQSR